MRRNTSASNFWRRAGHFKNNEHQNTLKFIGLLETSLTLGIVSLILNLANIILKF